MTFGERLRQAREAKGLTQDALAKQSGIPIGNIRDWEQDRTDPLFPRVARLAAVLGISLDDLAPDVTERKRRPKKKK